MYYFIRLFSLADKQMTEKNEITPFLLCIEAEFAYKAVEWSDSDKDNIFFSGRPKKTSN